MLSVLIKMMDSHMSAEHMAHILNKTPFSELKKESRKEIVRVFSILKERSPEAYRSYVRGAYIRFRGDKQLTWPYPIDCIDVVLTIIMLTPWTLSGDMAEYDNVVYRVVDNAIDLSTLDPVEYAKVVNAVIDAQVLVEKTGKGDIFNYIYNKDSVANPMSVEELIGSKDRGETLRYFAFLLSVSEINEFANTISKQLNL